MKLAVFLPELLRHLFKKPATVDYPFKKLAVPADFRGTPYLNPEMCIVCRACERDCPAEAIESNGGVAVIDDCLCILCGACQVNCPQSAVLYDGNLYQPDASSPGVSSGETPPSC